MKRASRSIQLVLITSTALWFGCEREPTLPPGEWVDDGNGASHYVPSTQPGHASSTGYRSGTSTYHHYSSSSGSRSSSSSGSSFHSSSSGTSRGGFGSSGHASSSGGS